MSSRTRVTVRDVEAEISRSGNAINVVEAEQSAAAAAGLIAIAAALTGGVNVDLNNLLTQATESDRQHRQQLLETLRSARS